MAAQDLQEAKKSAECRDGKKQAEQKKQYKGIMEHGFSEEQDVI